jgi:hypothetical protein
VVPEIEDISAMVLKAKAAANLDRVAAQQYLTGIGFDNHIALIESKIENLTGRGYTDASGVSGVTRRILQGIKNARDTFLITNDKDTFKDACKTLLNDNSGVLEQQRGIKSVTAPIVKGFLALLAALRIITPAQKESGFFSMKTESAQIAMNFKSALSEERNKNNDASPTDSDDSAPDICPRR